MGRAYRYFLGNCCFHIVEQRVIGGGGMGHSPSTMGEATTRLQGSLQGYDLVRNICSYIFFVLLEHFG